MRDRDWSRVSHERLQLVFESVQLRVPSWYSLSLETLSVESGKVRSAFEVMWRHAESNREHALYNHALFSGCHGDVGVSEMSFVLHVANA